MAQERVRAPELEGGIAWLNTDQPLTLAKLKGKVVLLDFWTYCCINCMHIIPDLKKLEAKYANQLVVIGVHSAKFSNEGESDNIRQAILRYEIEHPVVNDREFRIWRRYGVQAWPTQVLIDPEAETFIQALRTQPPWSDLFSPSPCTSARPSARSARCASP